MQNTLIFTLLITFGLFQADTLPERRGIERGNWKERAPETQDRLLPAQPVHQDTTGSCDQLLLALDGSAEGGFGAVWMDTRQGSLGLYLGMVGADGAVKGEEQPLYPSGGTARQLQPDLAFTDEMNGMLCWRSGAGAALPIQVRRFRGGPGFRDEPLEFGAPAEAADVDPRSPVNTGDRGGRSERGAEPRVAKLANGESFVAWTQGGAALAQHFDGEGKPLGEVLKLDPDGPKPTGSVRVASNGEGHAFVIWPTAKGSRIWIGAPKSRAVRADLGEDAVLDVAADPQGGWWLLLQPQSGEALLRHLGTRGARDRDDQKLAGGLHSKRNPLGAWNALDLCVWKHGVAIAATSGRGETPISVLFLGTHGVGDGREWYPLAKPGAMAAQVASEGPNGDRLLVAWTDARNGDRDIFYSVMQPLEKGGLPEPQEALRWNTDIASAGQSHPALASNGKQALLAWRDERSGSTRIWLRGVAVSADGESCDFAGPERAADVGERSPKGEEEPALAMLSDGRALLTWRRVGEPTLHARPVDAVGKPRGEIRALGDFKHDVVIQAQEEGFLLLARAPDGSLFVQALDADGAPRGNRVVVSGKSTKNVENAKLARLDDGRWLVLWDEPVGKAHKLVGRMLSPRLKPVGAELSFDFSGRDGDLQPAAAPGPKNGFVMSWTAFDSRGRDVAARPFDSDGKPTDRPLGISPTYSEQDTSLILRLANGEWVVVWEDDISLWDQIHARRISKDLKEMGPTVTLNDMEMSFTMGCTGPVAAVLGDGLIVAFVDRGRGLGPDVFVTVVGSAFDEL